jgi:hypothetical protein
MPPMGWGDLAVLAVIIGVVQWILPSFVIPAVLRRLQRRGKAPSLSAQVGIVMGAFVSLCVAVAIRTQFEEGLRYTVVAALLGLAVGVCAGRLFTILYRRTFS